MLLCAGVTFAQDKNVTYEKKGDIVEVTIFNDNGQIEQHGFMKGLKLHGTWKHNNEQGEKLAIGNYENGVKNGTWTFWNEDNRKEVEYQEGKIVSVDQKENEKIYNE